MNRSGWTLMALVILLAVALIALAGISSGLAEGMRANLVSINQTKAIYLAYAGVMDAIRSYETGAGGRWFSLGEVPVVAPNEVFIRPLTSQRDVLLVNMASAALTSAQGGTTSNLTKWSVRNVGPASPGITITKLRVEWTQAVPPDPSERVTLVGLNGQPPCQVLWSGSKSSGEEIDIPDCVLSSNTVVGSNLIRFNRGAIALRNPLTITVTFIMADAGSLSGCTGVPPASESDPLLEHCQRTVRFVRGGPNAGLFTVRSSGEVRGSPFTIRRTVRAEFRDTSSHPAVAPPNRILAWAEE